MVCFIRNQTMSPPVLKSAHIVMVIIGNSIAHLLIIKKKFGKSFFFVLLQKCTQQIPPYRRIQHYSSYHETFKIDNRILNTLILPEYDLRQLRNVVTCKACNTRPSMKFVAFSLECKKKHPNICFLFFVGKTSKQLGYKRNKTHL